MAVIVIEKGKQQGLRFEVHDDARPTVLGRDPIADIVVDDERASRQHARICRRLGGWVLEDLGSRNGILAGGREVRTLALSDGSLFQIGSTVLVLREGERIDPLGGMEVQGAQLLRLLGDEAGVLSYRAHQLAMDRPVRVDILHPRWSLAPHSPGAPPPELAPILPALQAAAADAAYAQGPRTIAILRAELPDERGGGFTVLRWQDAPTLAEKLPEILGLPVAGRILFFRRLAEAVLARDIESLGYPIGLRHVLVDPETGPLVQALELSALIAVLRGCARDLVPFPAYLPPEQAERGSKPSRASLVYNLGCLGYHVLTRLPPMGEGSVAEILARHRTLPAAPADLACPEVPARLTALLAAMVEKDPGNRPCAREAILAEIPACPEEIEAALAAEPTPDPAPDPAAAPAPPRAAPGRPGVPPPASPKSPVRPGDKKPAAAPRPPAPVPVKPRPAVAEERRKSVPIVFQVVFWPALWSGLFFLGRWLVQEILRGTGR